MEPPVLFCVSASRLASFLASFVDRFRSWVQKQYCATLFALVVVVRRLFALPLFHPRLFVRLRLWSRPSLSSRGPVVALKGSPSNSDPCSPFRLWRLDFLVVFSRLLHSHPSTVRDVTGAPFFFFAADLEIDVRQTARAGLLTSRALAVSPCTSFLSAIIIQVIFATVLRFSAMCNLRSQSWPQVQ